MSICYYQQIPNLTGKEGESHQCQDLPEQKEEEPSKKKARFEIPTKDTGIQPMQYVPSVPTDKHSAAQGRCRTLASFGVEASLCAFMLVHYHWGNNVLLADVNVPCTQISKESATVSNTLTSSDVGESREKSDQVTKPTSSSSVEAVETETASSSSVKTSGMSVYLFV